MIYNKLTYADINSTLVPTLSNSINILIYEVKREKKQI